MYTIKTTPERSSYKIKTRQVNRSDSDREKLETILNQPCLHPAPYTTDPNTVCLNFLSVSPIILHLPLDHPRPPTP